MKKDDGESLYLKCDDGKDEGGSVTDISEGMKMRIFRRNSERIQRKLAKNLRLNEEDEGKRRMELRKGMVFLRISRERRMVSILFFIFLLMPLSVTDSVIVSWEVVIKFCFNS
ncbi:hypothetical protein RYX36_020179 [Vicia faba]